MSGVDVQKIPQEIRKIPQWVVWKAKPKSNGKMDKIPYSPITDKMASVKDPSTWSSFEDALSCYKAGGFSGVGFVFTQDDPYCGIDVDSCRNPETGIIEPWAKQIIEGFQSYAEVSPSDTGGHIITQGKLPEGGRKKGNIEIYDKGRFFTFTGKHLDSTPQDIRPAQEAINRLLSSHFKKEDVAQAKSPYSLPQAPESDTRLIQKAISARNGNKFELLYKGLWENAGNPSQSEGDQAFCNLLAFWTGKDAGRMDAIFRQSGLMRPKWDKKHYGDGRTHGQATIEKAIESCGETYTGSRSLEFTPKRPPDEACELYDGCSDTDKSVEGISSEEKPKPKIINIELIANVEVNDKPVIKGLLGENESLIISAASGTGKSLLVSCIALILGNPPERGLWGLFQIPYEIRTLIIQSENGFNAFNKRLNKLFNAHPEMRKGAKNVFTILTDNDCRIIGDLKINTFQQFLIKSLISINANVLILDPLISYHSENENDNSEMRKPLDCLSKVCDKVNVSCIICHHYNRQNLTRGATAIRDWTDNMLLMDFEKKIGDSTILKLTHDKSRNYEQQPIFYLERTPDLQFLRCEKPGKQAEQIEAVVNILEEMGGQVDSQSRLKNKVMVKLNCSEATARRAINEALEMRKIIVNPNTGGAYSYTLPQ